MDKEIKRQAEVTAKLLRDITESNVEDTYNSLMMIPQHIMVQCAMALALTIKEN